MKQFMTLIACHVPETSEARPVLKGAVERDLVERRGIPPYVSFKVSKPSCRRLLLII